jgi:hypothetical protein
MLGSVSANVPGWLRSSASSSGVVSSPTAKPPRAWSRRSAFFLAGREAAAMMDTLLGVSVRERFLAFGEGSRRRRAPRPRGADPVVRPVEAGVRPIEAGVGGAQRRQRLGGPRISTVHSSPSRAPSWNPGPESPGPLDVMASPFRPRRGASRSHCPTTRSDARPIAKRRTATGPGLTATPTSSGACPCRGISAGAVRIAASHRLSDAAPVGDRHRIDGGPVRRADSSQRSVGGVPGCAALAAAAHDRHAQRVQEFPESERSATRSKARRAPRRFVP